VLFAQLINDPGGERGWGKYPGQTKKDAQRERERLFDILRELVKWENTHNEDLLEKAREEIRRSWRETCEMNKGKPGFDPDKLPAFHDPFAGGGAIPLEAQRLGLEAYASDLNPVAVLINKAMIEIPPKFAGKAPVGPIIPEGEQGDQRGKHDWTGAQGLAEDVRRYGHWMRKEAEKRIGHLYPKVKITKEMVDERSDLAPYLGRELTVIAWIWARTVKSPNPAFSHVDVPLASTFMLSTKKGKEAYVQPVIEGDGYRFEVKVGKPEDTEEAKKGTKLGRGAKFKCLMSGSPMSSEYVRGQFKAKKNKDRLMAIVAEGKGGRIYISPTQDQEQLARTARPNWMPDQKMNQDTSNLVSGRGYGITHWHEIFTPRQLVALTTFSDLVQETREKVISDAKKAGWVDDGVGLEGGGVGATAYGDAVAVYLAFAIDKGANYWSSICSWHSGRDTVTSTFGRQALPMVWDYTESNPFCSSSGNFYLGIDQARKMLFNLPKGKSCYAKQNNAVNQELSKNKIVSTDPPYYDNIGYADLSDFFYVWLRRSLKSIFPDAFSTMAVPKSEELVATPYRHGDKEKAEQFFMDGMKRAMNNLVALSSESFPATIYYAFRQADTNNDQTVSIGWETFLEAVIQSGFSISGTWPMRTEYTGNLKKTVNALASSIVLVCRKREPNAPSIPRRQFLRELKEELPEALETMIGGKEGATAIAPVDLAQAAIGPGMAIYSRYSGILEADGSKMSVRDALIQINKVIDEFFNEAEGDMDADTRFCIDWFMQYGFKEDAFGQADVLARAKGTTVDGLAQAGVVDAKAGKVRLLKFNEYSDDWDPHKDQRTPTWEALHQLIRALRSGGESEAGRLLGKMTERTESIRQLSYRLFTLCERKGWAEEARAYNELIASWYGTVEASASEKKAPSERQTSLNDLINN
jgi:putative DNA methylase